MSKRFSTFPTPKKRNRKKKVIPVAERIPLLVLAKSTEVLKRIARKRSKKNTKIAQDVSGSIKKTKKTKRLQKKIIRISVGKKFLLCFILLLRISALITGSFILTQLGDKM